MTSMVSHILFCCTTSIIATHSTSMLYLSWIQSHGDSFPPVHRSVRTPIGLSVVQLDKIEGGVLHIQNVDILDGTPLLDIKPYVPEFDDQVEVRTGWLEKTRKTVSTRKSDDRFK